MTDDRLDRPPDDVPADAIRMARLAFFDEAHRYGCAESAFIALKSVFGLPDPADSSVAMALNGGLAWTGGPCGAVTGAALALGLIAARRIEDHGRAKRIARELTARLIESFEARFGATECRDLVGVDLRAPGAHAAFIAGGTWRAGCMTQIEFAVAWVAALVDPAAWNVAVAEAERTAPG